MREVAIVGAGDLGGALAHVLARQDLVPAIRLIDGTGTIAAGKALDILQSAPIVGFATRVTGATDLHQAAGASLIVLADRAGGAEWQGEESLQMVRQIAQMNPRAVILCAGAMQRETIDRAVRELHFPRSRLFGSAPEALASGARAVIALALNVSARDVAATVLGVPPSHAVVTWQDATVGGVAVSGLVDEPARRRLDARIHAMWPPGPYALASAAMAAIAVMAGRSRRVCSCFVGPDTSAGTRTRTAALPVRLGPSGLAEVLTPRLDAAERTKLENALAL